jgi:hypothetical protein
MFTQEIQFAFFEEFYITFPRPPTLVYQIEVQALIIAGASEGLKIRVCQ